MQSLLSAGLTFKEAYETAQAVRKTLANDEVITTAELKSRVAQQLENDFGTAIRRNYEVATERQQKIIVHTGQGETPFSAGILIRSLEACAVDRKCAIEIAQEVQQDIQKRGQTEIDTLALRRLIYQALKSLCPPESKESC